MRVTATTGDITGAANAVMGALLNAAAKRAELVQLIIGCNGAPADATAKFALKRVSADGTGAAAVTMFDADEAEGGAPLCTLKAGYTTPPTYVTGNPVVIPLNQRSTLVYNVPKGFKAAVGAGKGWALVMLSGPALPYDITWIWDE